MSISTIKFLTSASATATAGSDTITITGNIDCRFVYSGSAVFLGTRHVVEAISGTSPDGSGNSTIKLRSAWSDTTVTGRLTIFNTVEGFAEAIRKAREIVAATESIATELNPIALLEGAGFIRKTGAAEYELVNPTTAGLAVLTAATVSAQRTALGLGTMATRATGESADQHRTNAQNDGRFAQLVDIQTKAQSAMLAGIYAKANLIADFVKNEFKVWEAPYGKEPKQLTDVVTTTRASYGTVNTPFGVETRTSNIARIEYDPLTGEPLGLLCEEARTNLIYPSQDVTGYSVIRGSVVKSTTVPNRYNDFACLFTLKETGACYARKSAFTTEVGKYYCHSFEFKVAEAIASGLNVIISLNSSWVTGGRAVIFDAGSQTLRTNTAGFPAYYGMDYLDNGWARIWGADLCDTAYTGINSALLPWFSGEVGSTCHYSQVQITEGESPSSAIVTTTAAVTRVAEAHTTTLDKVPPSATIATKFKFKATGSNAGVISLSDGTFNNRFELGISATSTLQTRAFNGGVAFAFSSNIEALVDGETYIAAMSYDPVTLRLAVALNGSVTNLGGVTNAGLNTLAKKLHHAGGSSYGPLKATCEWSYYSPLALSDAELIALTLG